MSDNTLPADDDHLDSVFFYYFAQKAAQAPAGKRSRVITSEGTEAASYVSNLPDKYTLSCVARILDVIELRPDDFPDDYRVHPLKRACARLIDTEADPPTLKNLFELCWGVGEKYTPEKARNRLAALPVIFVPQQKAKGGIEHVVYRRPQGGDEEISSFIKTLNILARKAAKERESS